MALNDLHATSIHEAGHALAFLANGFPVISLGVDSGGGHCQGSGSPSPAVLLVVAHAGAEAERMFTSNKFADLSGTDRQLAVKARDQLALIEGWPSQARLRQFVQATRSLVFTHREAIDTLAWELRVAGRIDRDGMLHLTLYPMPPLPPRPAPPLPPRPAKPRQAKAPARPASKAAEPSLEQFIREVIGSLRGSGGGRERVSCPFGG